MLKRIALLVVLVVMSLTICQCKSTHDKLEYINSCHVCVDYDNMLYIGDDNPKELNAKLKHIIWLDTIQCTSCLSNKWVLWEAFEYKAMTVSSDYKLILIIDGGDSTFLPKITKIKRYGGFSSTVLVDTCRSFVRNNKILNESTAFKSILLNDSNKIIAFGDPSTNTKLESIWLSIIKEEKQQTYK